MKIFKPKFIPYKNPNVIIDYSRKLPGNSAQELYYAQDVIGNYAKANNVKVKFFGLELEPNTPILNKLLSSNIGIAVSGKSNSLPKVTYVDYTKTQNVPFLRQVYKAIEDLVKQ